MAHTEGKLRVRDFLLLAKGGALVAEAVTAEDAKRLTAVWNAVEGLSNEEAEKLDAQRLVAAAIALLTDVCEIHEKPSAYRAVSRLKLDNLRAALAGIGEGREEGRTNDTD